MRPSKQSIHTKKNHTTHLSHHPEVLNSMRQQPQPVHTSDCRALRTSNSSWQQQHDITKTLPDRHNPMWCAPSPATEPCQNQNRSENMTTERSNPPPHYIPCSTQVQSVHALLVISNQAARSHTTNPQHRWAACCCRTTSRSSCCPAGRGSSCYCCARCARRCRFRKQFPGWKQSRSQ